MSKVELFTFDDWQILTIDERIVAENHKLGAVTVIDALFSYVNDSGIEGYTAMSGNEKASELLEDKGSEAAVKEIRKSFEDGKDDG